jgi:hypothetical protein
VPRPKWLIEQSFKVICFVNQAFGLMGLYMLLGVLQALW